MSDNGVPWYLSVIPEDEKEQKELLALKQRIAFAEARAALAEALARTTDAQVSRTKALAELSKLRLDTSNHAAGLRCPF